MGDYCVITGTVRGTLDIRPEGLQSLTDTPGGVRVRGPTVLSTLGGTAESRRRPVVGGIERSKVSGVERP